MNHPKEKQLLEHKLRSSVTLCLFLVITTGLCNYLLAINPIAKQIFILIHIIAGIGLIACIAQYLFLHFKRTAGFRRPVTLLTGVITGLLLLSQFYSGLMLVFKGNLNKLFLYYSLHQIIAILLILFLIAHIVSHISLLPKHRKNNAFLSSYSKVTRQIIFPLCIPAIILSIIYFLSPSIKNSFYAKFTELPLVKEYSYSYGKHPFRPSQTETYQHKFIDEKLIGNSADCASCHTGIAKQWFSSAHKQAASDPAYVTNINLLVKNKGIEAARYCEGCHAPVALLSGALSPGGYHGGMDGTIGNIEGVGCMSCHGIQKASHLKGVASYYFDVKPHYLFAGIENKLLKAIHRLLIHLSPNEHRENLNSDFLGTSEFCATCHAQFMDKDLNNWGWVKMQDEYQAWLESPFSKQQNPDFSSQSVQQCQDCHMPLIKAKDPSADENGMVRSHYFTAANTVLPTLNGDQYHLEQTIQFLQQNKLHISIEPPHRKSAVQTRMSLDENIRDQSQLPWFFYLGEKAKLRIIVSNIGIGHNFPGGTTDLNEAWIELIVTDSSGKNIYKSGHMTDEFNIDKNAYFYRATAVDRHGKEVWKHDLFNMVGQSYKNVIKSGEADIVDYQFNIPSWANTPITVSATVKYRKFNERYARWALKDKYQKIPIVDMARTQLMIPLKLQAEVVK